MWETLSLSTAHVTLDLRLTALRHTPDTQPLWQLERAQQLLESSGLKNSLRASVRCVAGCP